MLMEHPLLKERYFIVIYILFWEILAILQTLLVVFQFDQAFWPSFIDASVSSMIYGILGFVLWFPTNHFKSAVKQQSGARMSSLRKLFDLNSLINITSVTIAVIFTWSWLSYYLAINLIDNEQYQQFIESSFSVRVVIGVFIYMFIHMDYHLLATLEFIREKEKNEAKLKDRVKDAELNLLKSQINPHFLFNSLNSISSLTMYEAEKAQSMIIKLSDYLRYSVSSGKTSISSFNNEIENIKRYMDIEKVRFGSRLEYDIAVDEQLYNANVPSMILQPLLENAVKHGVYESTETVTITCSAHMIDQSGTEMLQVEIKNDYDPSARIRSGTGTGLRNIAERLHLIYGTSQLLKIKKDDDAFIATVLIPQIDISDEKEEQKQ